MRHVAIVGARRTPIGSFEGALSSLPAHELGAAAIRAVLEEAALDPAEVDEAIIGQVLAAGQGMNPARQATRKAGIPDAAPAAIINQLCGSGLRAVALAAQQIQTAVADVVIAGGQESMSQAPYVVAARQRKRFGDIALKDTLLSDGLIDVFHGYHMGVTAENVARERQVSRDAQDRFALESQQKASLAAKSGRFAAEITPLSVASKSGQAIVDYDEYIRHDSSLEALAKLKPAFAPEGTVTPGNSSGINDGAAALILMDMAVAERKGLMPLGRVVGFAHAGIDPQVMGLGPVPASRKLLERIGWRTEDVDLWELNEAFAAQACAVVGDLDIDPARVNVNGGAIAMGHPIGASGARVLVTLLHEMARRRVSRGVAALCIGGGMGIALAVERV